VVASQAGVGCAMITPGLSSGDSSSLLIEKLCDKGSERISVRAEAAKKVSEAS
jgi:hypothetical protein